MLFLLLQALFKDLGGEGNLRRNPVNVNKHYPIEDFYRHQFNYFSKTTLTYKTSSYLIAKTFNIQCDGIADNSMNSMTGLSYNCH